MNKYVVTNCIENDDIIHSLKNDMPDTNEKNKNNIRSLDQIIKTPRRSVIPRSKKQSEYLKALLNYYLL